MLKWDIQITVGSEPLKDLIKKNAVVTRIRRTAWGLLDQRRSRSDNQAPLYRVDYNTGSGS